MSPNIRLIWRVKSHSQHETEEGNEYEVVLGLKVKSNPELETYLTAVTGRRVVLFDVADPDKQPILNPEIAGWREEIDVVRYKIIHRYHYYTGKVGEEGKSLCGRYTLKGLTHDDVLPDAMGKNRCKICEHILQQVTAPKPARHSGEKVRISPRTGEGLPRKGRGVKAGESRPGVRVDSGAGGG